MRYEPPGVGLELESHSGVVVRHKDLPAASQVTEADIGALVDSLLADEPEILSKRRHYATLVNLVGRLYQLESEDVSERRTDGPQVGQQVILVHCTGKLQPHNGDIMTVTKSRPEKDTYEVRFETDLFKVKAEQMVVVANVPLAIGVHVCIRGLRKHPELNGCLGRVVECQESNGVPRYEVRAESGQLFRVKHDNLTTIVAFTSKENLEPNTGRSTGAVSTGARLGDAEGTALEPGSLVQLHGLKSAVHFNGHKAEILMADPATGRYEIRMDDGNIKTVRADNVRLLSVPPKAGHWKK